MSRPMMGGAHGGERERSGMGRTMDAGSRKNYGILRGGLYANQPGQRVPITGPLMHELDRRVQDAFVVIHGDNGAVPSRGIYDIRCGAQHPARVLGRRCIEMRDAGAPVEQAVAVFEAGAEWVREVLYGSQPNRDRAA